MEPIIIEIYEHMAKFNDEMGMIQIDVAVLKAQVGELIWTQRIVLAIVIGFIVTRVLWMVVNKKNNK